MNLGVFCPLLCPHGQVTPRSLRKGCGCVGIGGHVGHLEQYIFTSCSLKCFVSRLYTLQGAERIRASARGEWPGSGKTRELGFVKTPWWKGREDVGLVDPWKILSLDSNVTTQDPHFGEIVWRGGRRAYGVSEWKPTSCGLLCRRAQHQKRKLSGVKIFCVLMTAGSPQMCVLQDSWHTRQLKGR